MLLSGQLHINHGVGKDVLVAQRHDAVSETLHDAALRKIELVSGPHRPAPAATIVVRRLLRVLRELGGDDKGRQHNELRVDGIDVELLVHDGCRWQGVPLGGRGEATHAKGALKAPCAAELGVKAVENAHGKGDGFEGEVCPAEDGLDKGDGGGG